MSAEVFRAEYPGSVVAARASGRPPPLASGMSSTVTREQQLRRIRWRLTALLRSGQLRSGRDYQFRSGRAIDAAAHARTLLALAQRLDEASEAERAAHWQDLAAFVERELVALDRWLRLERQRSGQPS